MNKKKNYRYWKYYVRTCPNCNRYHKTKTKRHPAVCFECNPRTSSFEILKEL
tara:strand:+ start:165 stop:320 length:156 start_codon:yes stop_codon:yes gene_type:complete